MFEKTQKSRIGSNHCTNLVPSAMHAKNPNRTLQQNSNFQREKFEFSMGSTRLVNVENSNFNWETRNRIAQQTANTHSSTKLDIAMHSRAEKIELSLSSKNRNSAAHYYSIFRYAGKLEILLLIKTRVFTTQGICAYGRGQSFNRFQNSTLTTNKDSKL